MTTPTKVTRKPRVPRTPAPAPEQKTAVPESYVISTALLVDVIKLVGALPAHQVGTVYYQLQRLQPIASVETPENGNGSAD